MSQQLIYIKKNRDKLMAMVLCLLVFLMPLSIALTNLMLIPAGALLIVAYSPKEWFLIKSPPIKLYIATITIMAILSVMKGSFLADIEVYLRYYGVVFLYILFSKISTSERIESFFIGGILIAMIIAIVKIINLKIDDPEFLFDTGLIIDQVLWENRPLAGFMVLLALFICLKRISKKLKNGGVFYFFVLVFLSFCMYISARLSIILIILTIFYFLFFRIKIKNQHKALASLFLLIVIALMILFNKSLMSRTPFNDKQTIERIIEKVKDREPRYIIWTCTSKLLQSKSNVLIGISGYDKYRQELVGCYGEVIVKRDEKKAYYMESRFNSHNQFLDFWLNGGIMPFLGLLLVFFSAFYSKNTSADSKWVYFLFFCFFLVENVLYRQMGYYLFGIFAALYSSKLYNENYISAEADLHEKSLNT